MVQPQPNNELKEFIEFLFGGLSGVAYVALKNPVADSNGSYEWTQKYFNYPEDSDRMETVIYEAQNSYDVYLSPVLYKEPNYRLENVKVSNVVWTEFDGNAPVSYEIPPSLRVRSSSASNEHVYWRLNEPITDVVRLQEINRAITYSLGADSSAWDATQILRPPETTNYKYDPPVDVTIILNSDTSYDIEIFNAIPSAPIPITPDWQPNQIPEVAKVILKYPFSDAAAELFSKPKLDHGARSTGLMQLAYFCCEMGMTNPEIYAVLHNADERWKKFAGRKDQAKRLAHIITVARNKHPEPEEEEESFTFLFDFVSFLNTDIDIDWVIEGMLMENGSMLMVGPGGIGKTQITMRFAMQLALGRDYWHYTIAKPRKMLFLSLEMGHGELKVFGKTMAQSLKGSDLSVLQENLHIIPHGEKWPLNKPEGQEQLLNIIEDIRPDGIMVDSVGSAIQGSINNDEHVQDLIDFNDRIRKRYGVFLWYIHHMRKSANGGHAPTAADDIYGNQYLFNRATSAYGVLRGKGGHIRLRNFKNRLAKQEDDYYVQRVEHLDFSKVNVNIDKQLEHIVYKKPENEKGPETHGKFNI